MSTSWNITEFGTLVIRQDAEFDLKAFHKALYQWGIENKYNYNEKTMQEKAKSHGKEIDIVWEYDRKVTDFIKFKVNSGLYCFLMRRSITQ